MRVLNINKFFYLRGGVERYFFALTKLLEENGHDVIHFSMKDERNFESKFEPYFVDNIDVGTPGLKLLNKAVRPIWYKQAQQNIEQLIDDYKPDVAHIHMLYHHLSPSILPVLKKRGIPVVMTVHDYKLICPNYLLYTENETCKRCKGHRYYNAVIHKCLKDSRLVSAYAAVEMSIHKLMQVYEKHVDLFIAPSEAVRDLLIEFGQNEEKVMVLPHFIDPAFLEKQNEAKPVKNSQPYILYSGRLVPEKGVDKLLQMLYIYKLPVQLKIAGTGAYEPELRAYIAEHGMDNVEFLGHLETNELIKTIKGASAVVMPTQFYELFGFSALETMALGTPLVASDIGALSELVPPELGRLFPKDDLGKMAEAVEEVLTWDKASVQKEAKRFIEKNFLSQKHYETLHDVYTQLLG